MPEVKAGHQIGMTGSGRQKSSLGAGSCMACKPSGRTASGSMNG